MPQTIWTHTLPNGLVLVAELMPHVESVAFTFRVPAGSIYDPPDRLGRSNVTCDMLMRGAGTRDARQFVGELDGLGVTHAERVSEVFAAFSAATLSEHLQDALPLYADLLRRPHLPAEELEAARLVALQHLSSIEDDPVEKLMGVLRARHFPYPYGRCPVGEQAGLHALQIDDVRRCFAELYRPNGTILGVAGRFDWPALCALVERLLADWAPVDVAEVRGTPPLRGTCHVEHASQQTQVGVAFDSVPPRHPDYPRAAAAVMVLSGGTSARLFTEVREKRGLCYAVYASVHALRDQAAVLVYAGTTACRAQETLDVVLHELSRLAQGIEPDELSRVKAHVRSELVVHNESSLSRAAALVSDYYHLGRVRTVTELQQQFERLTCEEINAYLQRAAPREFTIVTVGPQALAVGASSTAGAS
jgi:predicted Zn-dependent peptidase